MNFISKIFLATRFVYDKLESDLDKLEGNSELMIFWFESNSVKLSTDKCHLLVFSIEIRNTKYEYSWTKIGDDKIWESGEIIDNKLKFDSPYYKYLLENQSEIKCREIGEVVKF